MCHYESEKVALISAIQPEKFNKSVLWPGSARTRWGTYSAAPRLLAGHIE